MTMGARLDPPVMGTISSGRLPPSTAGGPLFLVPGSSNQRWTTPAKWLVFAGGQGTMAGWGQISVSLPGSTRRLAVRDGENPRDALGQAAVATDGQAPVPLRGGDRLTPEGDRTQRRRVGLERDRGVLGAAAGDVDGAVGGRQPVPVTVDAQCEHGARGGGGI